MEKIAKKILVVEDEHDLTTAYWVRLTNMGYKVEFAYDGLEALDKLKHFRPDLIILDLLLPRLDGFKFLEALKADSNMNQLPVMVVTNLDDPADKKRCFDLGVIDYIIKTEVSLEQMVEKVQVHI